MKKGFFCCLTIIFLVSLFSCSRKEPEKEAVLARVNDYNLILKEFQFRLADEINLEKDFKLTKEAKKEFLEGIIREELFIQEAKKMGMDSREKFVRAMEKYWKYTLIRGLMELKAEEISRRTYISQEEIEDYYNKMKKSEKNFAPLKAVEERITRELKEKKKRRMLKDWVKDLREKADIEIDYELLYK